MSYRFNVGVMENFAIEPYVLYRQSADGLQDAWEAASVVYYKDKIWTGAGYNQNNGLAVFLGLNLKDRFRVNYSYEFPPMKSGVPTTSSHELHMTMKFGKKKTPAYAKAKPRPTIYKRPANEVTKVEEEESDSAKAESMARKASAHANQEDTKIARNNTEKTAAKKSESIGTKANPEAVTISKAEANKTAETVKPVGKPAKSFTIAKGHYVVVAVFSMMDHSTRFTKKLAADGYDVNVALNPLNKFYYVYIFSTYDIDEAKKVRNQYRWKNLFKEAWVFTMD